MVRCTLLNVFHKSHDFEVLIFCIVYRHDLHIEIILYHMPCVRVEPSTLRQEWWLRRLLVWVLTWRVTQWFNPSIWAFIMIEFDCGPPSSLDNKNKWWFELTKKVEILKICLPIITEGLPNWLLLTIIEPLPVNGTGVPSNKSRIVIDCRDHSGKVRLWSLVFNCYYRGHSDEARLWSLVFNRYYKGHSVNVQPWLLVFNYYTVHQNELFFIHSGSRGSLLPSVDMH